MFTNPVNTLQQRAAFIALLARRCDDVPSDLAAEPSPAEHFARSVIVRVRGCQVISRRAKITAPSVRDEESAGLTIAALAAAFAERLHDVDSVAFTHAQSDEYAAALQHDAPRSRRSLYYMTRASFVTDEEQAATFNRVFSEVFGLPAGADRHREHTPVLMGA